ncbi:MAG: type II secretion system F family protein, partial [Minisyncoccia bacterium]
MAKFSYTAEKAGGEVYKGIAQARDRFELYEVVRREGGRIISVEEDTKGSVFSLRYWNSKITTVPEYEKILFARNLGTMLSAGLSLARALAVIERQSKNPRLARVVSEISSAVRRGESLHSALGHFPNVFSKLFIAMTRAGEEGGQLSQALVVVSDQMERMYVLKKKIRGALLYPIIIVVAIIGIGSFMMVSVVPTLAQTFEEMSAELPASTQAIISVSNFLVEYTVVALALVVILFGALYAGGRTVPGRRFKDFVSLRMPLIGPIVKEVNAARTSRTLASLLSSGVDVITALDIVSDV